MQGSHSVQAVLFLMHMHFQCNGCRQLFSFPLSTAFKVRGCSLNAVVINYQIQGDNLQYNRNVPVSEKFILGITGSHLPLPQILCSTLSVRMSCRIRQSKYIIRTEASLVATVSIFVSIIKHSIRLKQILIKCLH